MSSVSEISSDFEAGIRAVCMNPDDDAPRLIFADWLDDHGDSNQRGWAETIRRQVHKVREHEKVKDRTGGGFFDTEDVFEWKTGEGEPLRIVKHWNNVANNGVEWEMVFGPPIPGVTYFFHRGFMSAIKCDVLVFQDNFEQLFRLNPITRVDLSVHRRLNNGITIRETINQRWVFSVDGWNFCEPDLMVNYSSYSEALLALARELVNRGRAQWGYPRYGDPSTTEVKDPKKTASPRKVLR